MNKKFLILILIGVILLGGVSFLLFQNKNNQPVNTNGIILFYGIGCPYCAKVDEFIKENDVEAKVDFVRKEIRLNQRNAELFLKLTKECGIADKDTGIPLLWDGSSSKCIIGDEDIIQFFKEKISSE